MSQHGEKSDQDTGDRQERPDSPVPSIVSMKSDRSKGIPILFSTEDKDTQPKQERPDSPVPTIVSMKSDRSKGIPILFSTEDTDTQPKCQTVSESPTDILLYHSSRHKSRLETQFQNVQEGSCMRDSPAHLQDIYTDLHITEQGVTEVNTEHEVRRIETASWKTELEDSVISYNDIFKSLAGQCVQTRTVMTTGLAGIGKTVMVRKFILDWAQGRANQDVHFIIPIEFRELNLVKEKKYSIISVLCTFIESIKDVQDSQKIKEYIDRCKVLFILDGLDECRISLDFQNSDYGSDIIETASVDILLTNLIKRNLLPSALVWITSRPAAVSQIPPQYIDRVTHLQGFTDPQKDEYFRKTISDECLADRALAHLKSCKSLYNMCYIPLFSWMSSVVLERRLKEAEKGEIPTTLTQMYTQFLVIHVHIRQEKYMEITEEEMILKLGKLAFEQLQKGNLIFYEEDLRDCGLDVKEASLYSGVCTEMFRKEFGLFEGKVFCFVHLSVQEYLAALYAYLTYVRDNTNVLDTQKQRTQSKHNLHDLYKTAVDLALQSRDGHLDLFLRFLLGLSQESNQKLLRDVLPQIGGQTQRTVPPINKYLKKMICENPAPEKSINLFHCMNEVKDHSLVSEMQSYLQLRSLSAVKLSTCHWAALNFVLLTSGRELDVFDLSQYGESRDALHHLLPVVKVSRTVLVTKCSLADKICEELAGVVISYTSSIRTLDLSFSKLSHAGVMYLKSALENPNCKLQAFRLNGCKVPPKTCAMLATAFSKTSTLTELNLNDNEVGDSGAQLIAAGLQNPQCKLQILRLRCCKIAEGGFQSLASALRSNPSLLRELDLSMNMPGHPALEALCDALCDPLCELHILKLNNCNLTEQCCVNLASVLEVVSLRELHLNDNMLQDTGVSKISSTLARQNCELEVLKLCNCSVTEEGFGHLASALRSNPSHLRELYLNWNPGKERGEELLRGLQQDQEYALDKLEL